MADDDRTTAPAVNGPANDTNIRDDADAWLRALQDAPHAFDFYQALRRLECLHRDKPRWGMAQRPSDEPVRLGQEASLIAAPATLSRFLPATATRAARLYSYFFGVLGPNGPLPLHLTEYARQRVQLNNDGALVGFLDLFHHRLLALFYRAWSSGEPVVQRDRPNTDRFAAYVNTLFGLGLSSMHERDAVRDDHKRYYASLFAPRPHNAAGLRAILQDYLCVPAMIEEFVGEWVAVPRTHAWQLGSRSSRQGPLRGRLGSTALVGTRMWLRQHRFRVVLGPLRREQFRSFLPGTPGIARVSALVRGYVGDELQWDVRLTLHRDAVKPAELGRNAQLGRTSWLVAKVGSGNWADLVLDPAVDYGRKVGSTRRPPSPAPARQEI